ncbi:hypothetical protein AQ490_12550 [Wenjunlia vitaminophila]|uniref:DUF8094 domain-containing protein n=1 Tax=Wenjunlia vitaminophila TaxID=76728 RepID=A0A0T6LLH0_WENVI|nr:hypothetical protein AQ490_12550 [Wenjunlia vitaminophila]
MRRAAVSVAPVVLMASGCVTVHGEDAMVPAVDKAEAAKVVRHFATTSNRVNRDLDAELNATVEAGVLAAIDEASLKVRRSKKPEGDPEFEPLELSDTTYLVPELRGGDWPKWFMADTANNRGDDRWLFAFVREGKDQPWRATYLTAFEKDEMPEFELDEDGLAQAVPVNATGLAVAPGRLSETYTDYLAADRTPDTFEDGPATSELREARQKERKTARYVTQFVDQPVTEERFAPLALRTADGGALVMFTTRHSWKITYAQGVPLPPTDDFTKVLMSGTPKRSVTRTALAEQAAVVPKGSGPVTVVNRISGVISARGE